MCNAFEASHFQDTCTHQKRSLKGRPWSVSTARIGQSPQLILEILEQFKPDWLSSGQTEFPQGVWDIVKQIQTDAWGNSLDVCLPQSCQSSPCHVDVMMVCWPGRLHGTGRHVEVTNGWNNTDNERNEHNERNEKIISVSWSYGRFSHALLMMMRMPIQYSFVGAHSLGRCEHKSSGGWKRFCMAYRLRCNAADPEFTTFRVWLPPATIQYVQFTQLCNPTAGSRVPRAMLSSKVLKFCRVPRFHSCRLPVLQGCRFREFQGSRVLEYQGSGIPSFQG